MTAARQIDPQIELARAVLKSKTPLFGSCWGLQVITVAAGGMVRRNPKGREIGIGRRIALTPAGRGHPMYAGKATVFDAVTVHLDEVETLAPGTTVLAANALSDVQAAEIRVDGAVAWGVQYHPEYLARATWRRSCAATAAADRAKAFSPMRTTRDAYVARSRRRSTASRPTSRSPGATASTQRVLDWRVRTTRDRQLDHASGAADAAGASEDAAE